MSGIQEAGQGHVPDSRHEGHRYSHRCEYQGCESGRQKLHPARNHSVSEHHSGQSQADDYCTHRQHQGLQRLILQYLRGRSPVQAQELVEPPVTGKNEAAVEPKVEEHDHEQQDIGPDGQPDIGDVAVDAQFP